MSIDDSGINDKISGRDIIITVKNKHPLIQLASVVMEGNFLFSGKCVIPNISDKKSIQLMLNAHQDSFNGASIQSASTDKGRQRLTRWYFTQFISPKNLSKLL